MEYVDILGVKISKADYQSAMEKIEHFLTDGRKHYIVTPNPEFVVRAQKDSDFRQILNQADLAIPDGVGLRMAAKFFSMSAFNFTIVRLIHIVFQGLLVGAAGVFKPSLLDTLPWAVTGTDLMLGLCELAAKKDYSIFLLGGQDGVAEEAAKRLKKQFANLNIVGTYEGDPSENSENSVNQIIRASENQIRPTRRRADAPSSSEFSGIDFLFVAYGAPKQEKWIACHLPKIPVKVAMGVGGAFDFITGKRKRAPKTLRRLGLEWLWRLIQEPKRFPRVLNATVKFPLLVFLNKIAPVGTGD